MLDKILGKTQPQSVKESKNLEDLTVIGSSSNFIGNLVSTGTIDIIGKFDGEIDANILNIRQGASVKGKVKAKYLQVQGHIEGELFIEKIAVKKTGNISGNLSYSSISIEDGACMECTCVKIKPNTSNKLS